MTVVFTCEMKKKFHGFARCNVYACDASMCCLLIVETIVIHVGSVHRGHSGRYSDG